MVDFQTAQSGHSAAGAAISRGLAASDSPWGLVTEHMARSSSAHGAVVTRGRDECWDMALGSAVMTSVQHRVAMTILKSHGNTGACMQLGVADATAVPFRGGSVGFYPYFGHVFTERDAFSGSVWGKKLMEGTLQVGSQAATLGAGRAPALNALGSRLAGMNGPSPPVCTLGRQARGANRLTGLGCCALGGAALGGAALWQGGASLGWADSL